MAVIRTKSFILTYDEVREFHRKLCPYGTYDKEYHDICNQYIVDNINRKDNFRNLKSATKIIRQLSNEHYMKLKLIDYLSRGSDPYFGWEILYKMSLILIRNKNREYYDKRIRYVIDDKKYDVDYYTIYSMGNSEPEIPLPINPSYNNFR